MKLNLIYLLLFVLVCELFYSLSTHAMGMGAAGTDPEVVSQVDLSRYIGVWHEVAHSPNFFQRNCKNSTAEYQILSEGVISVFNTCQKFNGKVSTISGTAKVVDEAVPAKLKVRFSFYQKGDYWITDLDENYQWAVVSSPGKKFTFILARTAPLANEVKDKIIANLKTKGFDTDSFVFDQY